MAETADDRGTVLSTKPAGPWDRKLALVVVALSVALFLLIAPFAKLQLPQVWAFIPSYDSALIVSDLVTAALLFTQFRILRWRALLVLASSYLFTAFIAVSHALSFPGLFSTTGLLGAGPQSTAWLYMSWHGGFPLFVIAYALLKGKAPQPVARGPRLAILASVASVLVIVAACTAYATAGQDFLPAIMAGSHYTPAMLGTVSGVWILSFLALAVLWQARPHSVLDLWLMVVMCAWIFDIGLSAVLNHGRFDLGFYSGRIYGLIAASFVLIMLLTENSTLYARLAAAHEGERRERRRVQGQSIELAAVNQELAAVNQTLERRARSIDILGRTANRLLSCVNETELQEIVRRNLPQIFPGMPGGLYTVSDSQTILHRVADWTEEPASLAEFTPSQCWGLRRGQPHSVSDASKDVMCDHLRPRGAGTHHCLPLVAQGETVGLLYLEEKAGLPPLEKDYLPVLTEAIASSVVNLRLREKLRNQSLRDPLTGLFNRRYLEESLEMECARALRSGQPLSVAMMDIDHFKRFNDTFGHDAGDVVLTGLADLLRRLLRQGDVACRHGGEEFVVVLPATSAKDSLVVLERIRAGTESLELSLNGQSLGTITVSIGVAPLSPGTSSPASLLEAADRAMYAAKRGGRNRIEESAADPQRGPERSATHR